LIARNESEARKKLLADCKRPAFARLARYSKNMEDGSGDVVTRASIKFLETALARWGNVRVQNQIVEDSPRARKVLVIITDLEGGAEYSKEILVEKVADRKTAGAREKILGTRKTPTGDVFLVEATEDDLLAKEAVLASIVVRQLGLRLLPADLVEECMAQVAKTLKDEAPETIRQEPIQHDRQQPRESRSAALAKSLKQKKSKKVKK
jgi:hypothetical protein